MAVLVNVSPSDKLLQYRAIVRVVSKSHGGVMPNQVRQILQQEAEAMDLDPLDVRRILGMYSFSQESWDRWVSVGEGKFPRWKVMQNQPELGTYWRDLRTNMEFVWVPGGEYEMGNLFAGGFGNEKPVHEVSLNGFWLGRFPVIQEEWIALMGENPPAYREGERLPVEQVSWEDAQAFIDRLNEEEEGRFRLPTEAEWEYAARSGGKKEEYAGGKEVNEVAWHSQNSAGSSHPVGGKEPNGLGLYDMSGNVLEWCSDWFDEEYYKKIPAANPKGPAKGTYRVLRGGSWDSAPNYVRTSARNYWEPDNRDFYTGFRVVRNSA
ncbi:formylglycine-generating enzyme family protein [Candidatus Magnetaquicoccus inordinatus]|uniref:formylglycine-generating enzyme family protein n=1 Tax=Candidatus Magnetaquicoccus inordinatus TaxID=2496818 RepID=UPI001D0E01CB|nr:formylglycine-generating enzyme family protein [Candidatus Magnetaquicoccus inordinatus]